MHKAVLLPIIVLAATAVGGLLFLYGGAAFHPTLSQSGKENNTNSSSVKGIVSVLEEGTTAASFDQRENYRITDAEQFSALWQMLYTDNGPVLPNIDFSKYEVLAVFDGSHTSGGYGIKITNITDANGTRSISVVHTKPGDSCVTSNVVTSPFVIVQVNATTLPLTHVDETQTTQCP
jgi:hypothetical protein